MIAIVNYGMGNLGSIKNMLDRIRVPSVITSDPKEIAGASKLILPGVGSFDHGMKKLHEFGLRDVLDQKVLGEKIPVLGVCLGMQLISQSSEEGVQPGLGWIDAKTVRFRFPEGTPQLRVPHMGWNSVHVIDPASLLYRQMEGTPKFYFVHSYHVVAGQQKITLGTTAYGFEFVSSVHADNIYGVQFHPEKSHKYGMQLYINFAAL